MMIRYLTLLAACLCTSFAFAATRPVPPPPRLIGTDAAIPIELRELSISAEISGGMAQTTVRMVFFNPNDHQLEGQLAFPLRDGQQISAFALDIDGAMRPAVPVEKVRGRAVFEAVERRRIDPALLETTEGCACTRSGRTRAAPSN